MQSVTVMNIMPHFAWVFVFLTQAAAVFHTEDSHQLRRSNALPLGLGTEVKTREPKEKRLMDVISKFRAEICFKMKEEHGKNFESFEACETYMEEACSPGKDHVMDGDKKEVTSGQGYCKEYFHSKKKAEEQIDKEDKEDAAKAVAAAPAKAAPAAGEKAPAAVGPAAAAAVRSPAAPVVTAGQAPAAAAGPAPGPASAPSPGPVPGPYTPGVSGGKPWGPIAKDEAYYYKKGGKDAGRFHMSEKQKLPTQGYWGKLVEHNDGETSTGDWGKEFDQHREVDIRKICAEKKDNAWCAGQGYYSHKSSSAALVVNLMSLVSAFAVIRAL